MIVRWVNQTIRRYKLQRIPIKTDDLTDQESQEKRKWTFSLVPLLYPLLHDQGGDATSCHPGRKYPASTLDLAANLIMRTELTLNPWRTTQWPEIRVQHQWLASTSPTLKTASAGEVRGSEAARTFAAGGAWPGMTTHAKQSENATCVWW